MIQKHYYKPRPQSSLILDVFPHLRKTWGFRNSDLLGDNEVTEIIAGETKEAKKHSRNIEKKLKSLKMHILIPWTHYFRKF